MVLVFNDLHVFEVKTKIQIRFTPSNVCCEYLETVTPAFVWQESQDLNGTL
jgi:hypothetical protein